MDTCSDYVVPFLYYLRGLSLEDIQLDARENRSYFGELNFHLVPIHRQSVILFFFFFKILIYAIIKLV